MIRLKGVRVHNLKGIDLDIPHRQWLSICGLSGSGKTSLALDTLYAEGQRRYMESLSPYTRQFLQQLDKPDAERIDGIPPSVAVRAVNRKTGARATVGTSTGAAEHLRLLFAKIGDAVCPQCGNKVQCDNPDSAAYELASVEQDKRMQIAFTTDDQLDPLEALTTARRNGFGRAVVNGRSIELSGDIEPRHFTPPTADILVIVDRLKTSTALTRISESLETAFQFGGGRCLVLVESEKDRAGNTTVIDSRTWKVTSLSRELVCGECGFNLPSPTPKLFSSTSALGACAECEGFGSVFEFDMDLIVPDPSLSIREGAIAPWNTPAYEHELEELLELADDYSIPVDRPFSSLNRKTIQLLWDGVPERNFGGLTGFFNWLERRKYKMHLRVFLSRWRKAEPCPQCNGDRLNKPALGFRVGEKNYAQLSRMKLDELLRFFDQLQLADARVALSRGIRRQIETRLRYLNSIGLSYLWLDRQMRTLSGGEAARVGLTTSLSSTLVNMLYVLDEPS
ncbi:MAG: excinuclease ABC subunit A, partial [Planctomycetota bacterium]